MPTFKFDIGDEVYFCLDQRDHDQNWEKPGLIHIEKGKICRITAVPTGKSYIYFYTVKFFSQGFNNNYQERFETFDDDDYLFSTLERAVNKCESDMREHNQEDLK
ncbi:MAG: hypothetical protein WC917_02895 [Bacilli bacterium]|jgi:hypothetical protein